MINLIEKTDKRQQTYWRRFLISWILLLLLLVVRYLFGTTFREHELNSHPIGIAVLVVSIVLLITMLIQLVRLGQLKKTAWANPQLKEALIDNELVKLHLTQSWKAGFIGSAVTPFVMMLLFVDDPLLVAFATPTIGSVAFIISFYLKSYK